MSADLISTSKYRPFYFLTDIILSQFFAKSDEQIKDDVINELTWDQRLDSTNVKVQAKDGIVTLTGTVPHYMEKRSAEQAAVSALKWNYSVLGDLKISVDKGWVNLSGNVHSISEFDDARHAAWMDREIHGDWSAVFLKIAL